MCSHQMFSQSVATWALLKALLGAVCLLVWVQVQGLWILLGWIGILALPASGWATLCEFPDSLWTSFLWNEGHGTDLPGLSTVLGSCEFPFLPFPFITWEIWTANLSKMAELGIESVDRSWTTSPPSSSRGPAPRLAFWNEYDGHWRAVCSFPGSLL